MHRNCLRNQRFRNRLRPMLSSSDRRDFLKAIGLGVAGFSIARTAFAAASDSAFSAKRLTDNLTLVTAGAGNVVVLNTADGLLLVNGTTAERAADLLKFLGEEFKGRRV